MRLREENLSRYSFLKGCKRAGGGPSLGQRHAAGKLLTIYDGAQQGASSNLEPKLLHQIKTTFLLFLMKIVNVEIKRTYT